MRIITLLLAASFASACANGPSTAPTDARLAGTWAQRTAVSGVTFVLRLDTGGAAIMGSGTYTTDSGRSGVVTATGSSADGGVRLSLAYGTDTAQFIGARVNDVELSGSLHLGPAGSLTPAQAVSFDRRD